jgi:multidrug efflux pump subunit AcrA (membrane-fusion protein)
LQRADGQDLIFVFDAGRARQRTVTLGGNVGELREVKSGVSAGESVILDPPAALKDGAAVALAKP